MQISKPGAQASRPQATNRAKDSDGTSTRTGKDRQEASSSTANANFALSEEERAEVVRLQARDREVRTHEQAHASVGGQYAGAPKYSYTQGPDGKRYATDGEVSIDVAPIPGDPEATLQKMQQVRAAAMAPANPSSADRAVAQQAAVTAAQARAEQFNEVKSLQNDGAVRALGRGANLNIAV